MNAASSFNERASAPAREASTQSKVERVTQFAEKQFDRCKDQWTAQYYDRLIKREGHAPSLQPRWATNDRQSHMMRAASNIQRIDRAADRLAGRKRDGLER
jgi:hypothetical protein